MWLYILILTIHIRSNDQDLPFSFSQLTIHFMWYAPHTHTHTYIYNFYASWPSWSTLTGSPNLFSLSSSRLWSLWPGRSNPTFLSQPTPISTGTTLANRSPQSPYPSPQPPGHLVDWPAGPWPWRLTRQHKLDMILTIPKYAPPTQLSPWYTP